MKAPSKRAVRCKYTVLKINLAAFPRSAQDSFHGVRLDRTATSWKVLFGLIMLSVRRQRFQHRLLAHHVPLFLLSALCVAALYYTRSYRDSVSRASFATAYPALILLVITLLIGPWNVLRKRRNPISSDLRRDIGIWAGLMTVAHSVIGQNVHLRGRPWLYYLYDAKHAHAFPLRHDLFGFSNYTGAVSTLVVLALLATSNDYFLRSLGTPRWKQLQRWNYAAFVLAAAHTIGYQIPQKQGTAFHVTVAMCIAITLALQVAGFMRRRAVGVDPVELRQTL